MVSSKSERAGRGDYLAGVIEAVVLGLTAASPWAVGGVAPFDGLLFAGIALLLVLWAIRILWRRQLSWANCPVLLCLGALCVLAMLQVMPLPPGLLSFIAPPTSRLYSELLPKEPEIIPGEESLSVTAPGTTLSLYPGATRRELFNLFGVFLLFAVVRNNIVSPATLGRLSIVCVVNGGLLSLFALFQFYSSRPGTVYWGKTILGEVFGPFICRNHFPFYVNMCIGLGMGLLLSLGAGDRNSTSRDRRGTFASILQQPAALWILFALGLMAASTVFCLSRGGFLALLGAGCLGSVLLVKGLSRTTQLGLFLIIPALAFLLVLFFGMDPIVARWEGETLQQSRMPLWVRSLSLALEYPIWGTGYGTFQWIEPLARTDARELGILYENAHNEYLEAWVEGGIVRLVLGLLAIGLVFRLGYRALRRYRGEESGYLVWGALIAFATVVLHSFVDFGLHIPSIAFLATVICAQLSGLGARAAQPAAAPERKPDLLDRLFPLAGAVAAVVVAAILCGESWRAYRVTQLYWAASSYKDARNADQRSPQPEILQAAARLSPTNAVLRKEVSLSHLRLFEDRSRDLRTRQAMLSHLLGIASASTPGPGGSPSWALAGIVPTAAASSVGVEKLFESRQDPLIEKHLLPAMRYAKRSRDLCPLLREPHSVMATYGTKATRAEPSEAYLARAERVAPADPAMWFVNGTQYLQNGDLLKACERWRRSLELSDRFLPNILPLASKALPAEKISEDVLPDRPKQWIVAASLLFPDPEMETERRPFLEKGLSLYEREPGPWTAQDLYLKASAYRALGQRAAALEAYQTALDRDPAQRVWRLEYAQALSDEKSWNAARRQLQTILGEQPDNAQAKALLNTVTLEIAKQQ